MSRQMRREKQRKKSPEMLIPKLHGKKSKQTQAKRLKNTEERQNLLSKGN